MAVHYEKTGAFVCIMGLLRHVCFRHVSGVDYSREDRRVWKGMVSQRGAFIRNEHVVCFSRQDYGLYDACFDRFPWCVVFHWRGMGVGGVYVFDCIGTDHAPHTLEEKINPP